MRASWTIPVALVASVMIAPAAHAAYPQTVTVKTDGGQELPSGSIIFALGDGTRIPVEKDDDGNLTIIFPGDRSEPGTLFVTLPGKPIQTIAAPAVPPGQTLLIDLPTGTARAVPPPGTPARSDNFGPGGFLIEPFGGYGSFGVPGVGAGTLILPTTEVFAAETDDRIAMPFGGLRFAAPAFGGALSITGGYGEGSDSAANSTAAGGNPVGFVFTNFAPSGSTGLFLGPSALETRVDRSYSRFGISAAQLWPLDDGQRIFGGFVFGYDRHRTRIDASVSSPTFGNNIRTTLQQVLDQDDLSFGAALRYAGEFGGFRLADPGSPRGPSLSVGAAVLAVHRDVDLDSLQQVTCNVCGPADRSFTIALQDNDKGFSIGARLDAALGIPLSSTVSLNIGGGVEYRDKVAGIVNPRTGDDLFIRRQPTAIGYRSATNYYGSIGVAFGF